MFSRDLPENIHPSLANGITNVDYLWYGHQQTPKSGLERESEIIFNGFPPLSTSEHESFFVFPVG